MAFAAAAMLIDGNCTRPHRGHSCCTSAHQGFRPHRFRYSSPQAAQRYSAHSGNAWTPQPPLLRRASRARYGSTRAPPPCGNKPSRQRSSTDAHEEESSKPLPPVDVGGSMGTPLPSLTITRMRFAPMMAMAPFVPLLLAYVGGRLLLVAERLRAAACVTAEVAGGLDAALRLGPPRTMPGKGGGGGRARAALRPGRLLSLGGSEQAMMP
mmetsp:Transcript_25380/g.71213  ORF Transcript_25380/g.71213 Transcript_25380/m.71213 type:complete len:210 (-) Transcript_25380:234-863(-)